MRSKWWKERKAIEKIVEMPPEPCPHCGGRIVKDSRGAFCERCGEPDQQWFPPVEARS